MKTVLNRSNDTPPEGARILARHPFVYRPHSTSEVNTSRLPSPEELKDNQLAYREQTRSDEELRASTSWRLLLFLFTVPALIYLLLLVGPVIPPLWALGIVFLVSIAVVLVLLLVIKSRNFKLMLSILYWPILLVLGGLFVSAFIEQQRGFVSLALFAILVVRLLLSRKVRPLLFYRDFLLTHPVLKPETRHYYRRSWFSSDPEPRDPELPKPPKTVPSVAALFVVAVYVLIFALYEPGTAVPIVSFSAVLWLLLDAQDSWRRAIPLFSHYLTYSGRESGAAGVWIPDSTPKERRKAFYQSVCLFYAFVIIGLCLFVPANNPRLSSTFLNRLHAPPGQRVSSVQDFMMAVFADMNSQNVNPYAGLLASKASSHPVEFTFHCAGLCILAVFVSNGLLCFIFSPALKEAEKFRTAIEGRKISSIRYGLASAFPIVCHVIFLIPITTVGVAIAWVHIALINLGHRKRKEPPEDNDFLYLLRKNIALRSEDLPKSQYVPGLDEDDRTEWQCHVDRLRTSRHVATDPIDGTPVYESEHLFLGIEPNLNFPVLLDKRLLAEHCYIMGDSGSGKTTLGIMPMLIQLMRGNAVGKPKPTLRDRVDEINRFLLAEKVTPEPVPTELEILQARSILIKKSTYESYLSMYKVDLEDAEERLKELTRGRAEYSQAKGSPELKRRFEEYAEACEQQKAYNAELKSEMAKARSLIAQKEAQSLAFRTRFPKFDVDAVPGAQSGIIRDANLTSPHPIVIIDLKGDPALFQTVKAEAEARGQKFFFFTPEKRKATHRFNPFKDFESESRTPIQLCHLLLDALSLNHGEGYGRSYFSLNSRGMLFEALDDASKPRTFPALYQVLEKLSNKEKYEDAFELLGTVQALAQYKSLMTDDKGSIPEEFVIHMPALIEHSQVAYFWLPAAIESISAREIGKLAVYSLLTAAIDRQRNGDEHRQIYLVIDEFQRLAGENFRLILEQARSFGISMTLANQSIADLQTPDTDLRPTVRTNTRTKMFFSVTDPEEAQILSDLSGEDIVEERTATVAYNYESSMFSPSGKSESSREVLRPRLSRSDIQRYSDHPNDFILHVSRGRGYTQFGGLPIPVRTAWPIPFSLYKQRSEIEWQDEEEEHAQQPSEVHSQPTVDTQTVETQPKEVAVEPTRASQPTHPNQLTERTPASLPTDLGRPARSSQQARPKQAPRRKAPRAPRPQKPAQQMKAGHWPRIEEYQPNELVANDVSPAEIDREQDAEVARRIREAGEKLWNKYKN